MRAPVLLAAVALASPTLAHAQETITIADALTRADERAPEVAIAAAQAVVGHRDVGVAGLLPTPRIGGGFSVDYVGVLDLFVLLPIFGQLDTASDAARARAGTLDEAVDVARLDARLAVALAWTDLWLAERSATIADGDAVRRAQLEHAASARFEEGMVARIDQVRAAADAARATADATAAASLVRGASARLVGTLQGDASATQLRTSGDLLGAEVPRVDEETMLEAHPVARRLAASLHAAAAAVTHEHRSRWPRLGVQLSDWIHRSNDQHDVRLMLTMELALFDEPRIERAESVRAQAHVEEDVTLARLRAMAIAAREDWEAVRERCRAQSETVVPTAREAADLSREGYEEGSVDLTTTLASAQALAEAERSLAACLADRARAAARLDHAEGRSDDWR